MVGAERSAGLKVLIHSIRAFQQSSFGSEAIRLNDFRLSHHLIFFSLFYLSIQQFSRVMLILLYISIHAERG